MAFNSFVENMIKYEQNAYGLTTNEFMLFIKLAFKEHDN